MLRQSSSFLRKDYVETPAGFVFSLVQDGIEEGRVWGWLRYIRRSQGLTKVGTAEALQFAKKPPCEEWFRLNQRIDAQLFGIPTSEIVHQFQPELWFDPQVSPDSLQAQVAWEIASVLDVAPSMLGVTGSLLLGCARSNSDLDLVVYELKEFNRIRQKLRRLIQDGVFEELQLQDWQAVYERRNCRLSFEDYFQHERRKWNKFVHRGVLVDLTCVAELPSAAQVPGKKLRQDTIEANITCADQSFNNPALFGVDHPEVDWVLVTTATYVGQAAVGERMRASGWVEDCGDFRRLLVGTSREASEEFIQVISGTDEFSA